MLLGLTTWSEHQALVAAKKVTLPLYASKLPVVELDTFFYGIKDREVVQGWVDGTPAEFQFVIKAHQCMTLHKEWSEVYSSEKEMYQQYFESIRPLVESNKLAGILCQFPPYFDCTKENIIYLKRLGRIFTGLPVAIEFRHHSWYSNNYYPSMLSFMRENYFHLTIVDEPQVPNYSVPFLPVVTNPELVLVRLHGRNKVGWEDKTQDWRKVRTLYDYSDEELVLLGKELKILETKAQKVVVIFNNNSGGHAAKNCLRLKEMLDITYDNLNPEQMGLF
ncbi:DUF72 domain-containing protein [Vagococcus elongatus]|uniref:DUF72 domain-containing protein n=1 Tax=Vagococcus elongatus TaxID=180344 RepID=A0A430ARM7_9ENTE|nr:DUF72 domain-containing protein [Vagococcus elongatus]RSU10708.1 hypothetical protein CBF29_08970 [Vagococcus elongatus]